jgi:DNA-binding NtrC family response regulator
VTGAITVLIVDDEPDMCWALQHIIAQMGYQTVSAPSGQDVSQLVEGVTVELALVDAKLPDMEGVDLARQLRERRPNIPVVLVSGYFYEHDPRVQEWIRQGVIWGFIGKPFVLSQVRKAIEGAFASRSTSGAEALRAPEWCLPRAARGMTPLLTWRGVGPFP